MTGKPPPIDRRDRAALAAQARRLATAYSGWVPRIDGRADPGEALFEIFGGFAELVVQRVNRVLERDHLAFLDLLGARPATPVPARAPLSFDVTDQVPPGATVPAGTQVAAEAAAGDSGEVVLETEDALVVTGARLERALVWDAENDRYADRDPAGDVPFDVFTGDRAAPHRWYLAGPPALTGGDVTALTVLVSTGRAAAWGALPISWSCWDGAGWRGLDAAGQVEDGGWRVRLSGLPPVVPTEVDGTTAPWLRADLNRALPPGRSGVAPEWVCAGNRAPATRVGGLFPFGEQTPARWFYLSVEDAVASGGATVRIAVTLARAGVVGAGAPVRLSWSYRVGSQWRELGRSGSDTEQTGPDVAALRDGTRAFTGDGVVSFRAPEQWPAGVFQNRSGRWLRVEIDAEQGAYETLPQLAALTVGYGWDLPAVDAVTIAPEFPAAPIPPPAVWCDTTAVDPSRDFHPFGARPSPGATLYLACPPALARAESVLLRIGLRNTQEDGGVPPVRTDGAPRLTWETWDGTGWREVPAFDRSDGGGYAFTGDGVVFVELPGTMAETEVNGDRRFWLRIRLAGGNFGVAAGYRPRPEVYYTLDPKQRPGDPDHYTQHVGGGFEFVPETYAPPVIASVTWTATGTAAPGTPVPVCVTENVFRLDTVRTPALLPFTPSADGDPALHLGFDRPFGNQPVSLYLSVDPPAPDEVAADRLAGRDPADRPILTWEYEGPDGWRTLSVVDGTDGLGARGVVRFLGPPDQVPARRAGRRAYWLRLRWRAGLFTVPPRLRAVRPNTVWAAHTVTTTAEILGSGTGEAGQRLTAAQTPVLPGEQLTVREGGDETWTLWTVVGDFTGSGPADRHYTLDRRTGRVTFGDGHFGRPAPRGQNNVRLTYRTGGGATGNRPAGTIRGLRSALPYVTAVVNHEPATGGAAWEPVERMQARASRVLRHRDRAVTVEDLEDLAYASSTDVARARPVVPARYDPFDLWLDPGDPRPGRAHTDTDAGAVGVIVVPDSADPRPAPGLGLLRQVTAYLRARCPAVAELWVAGPEWIRVTVTATVAVAAPELSVPVRDAVGAELSRYLHPLTGGPDGAGWAFGRKPHRSDLMAVVTAVGGVADVRALAVDQDPESATLHDRLLARLTRTLPTPPAEDGDPELRRWLDRALVYSGAHRITVAWTE